MISMEKNQKWKECSPKLTFKSITLDLLEAIFGAMEDVATYNISRNSAYGAIRGRYPEWPDKNYSKWINNLKKVGYLEISCDKNQSVSFTGKAKLKLIDKYLAKNKNKKRYNRFLSFDIPEKHRSRRNLFRSIIKKMGFIQIQKSLWVCDVEVGELVQIAAVECRVAEYIVYMVSIKSDIDGIIDKKLHPKQ